MKGDPMRRALSLFACTLVFASLGCSSSSDQSTTDGDVDSGPIDVAYEEPILDGARGQVVLLKPYDPVNRCWFAPPTAVGHPDGLNPDGSFVCGTSERCYVRNDGIVFYAATDCVHGTNFLLPIKDEPYSDLGPCEVPKDLDLSKIADCPNPSCTFARDVLIDLAKGCAEAIDTRDCRDVVGAPTSCMCDPASTGRVFVAYDGKSTTNAPPSFVPCDSTNAACKKALGMVDTVAGCAIDTDAGTDAPLDAPSDVGGDADATTGDGSDGG